MSGKTANKKDVKPLVISGTSPKPHLKDDPINMSNTHEYVMQYTGIMQFIAINILTLSVPVSYQHPTSPYITHTK